MRKYFYQYHMLDTPRAHVLHSHIHPHTAYHHVYTNVTLNSSFRPLVQTKT